eukprot:TRINITY_DN49888_c0_g1_i1.p1 TRINITY_DN49888_c0_g1~~TRINITY_DN49888_c0_g1_i1.p1  ORF type:complete len:608 (+),score=245.84 TRINITY_DN49888_c0_g1_i1:159-1982(+)
MAEISYMYQRARREFGRPVEFQSAEPEELANNMPSETLQAEYMRLDPCEREIENIPSLSEAATNTAQIETKQRGQTHVEGGWPAQVDYTELDDKTKFRKKVEREEGYYQTCKRLVDEHAEKVLKQNNAIDIFEQYFDKDELDLSSGPPSAKTVTVFQDPSPVKRTVAKISWLPDGKKLAIAYCNTKFQGSSEGMTVKSHVWDVNNPNSPEIDLVPQSPLCCLQYSPKDTNIIAGGSYNGVVQLWDVRKASASSATEPKVGKPDSKSVIDDSHKDPVWDLKWLMSKSGEFLTVSTDGKAFIWDVRDLKQPMAQETITLKPIDKINEGGPKGELGGICIDYDAQVGGPSKYMVGTEQGSVLLCNRKGKSPQDKIQFCYNGHHGPVYSVMRNPGCSKVFLTVGDWTTRLWQAEDAQLRTPLFQTFYHKAYLTGGIWHPVRTGVFLTSRMDGVMNVWDLLYRQSAPVLSVQVSDFSLNTLQCTNEGRHVAVGGVDGNTVLLELSQGLCQLQNEEKQIIEAIFQRESGRDRALGQRAKERKQKGRKKSTAQQRTDKELGAPDEAELQDMTQKFLKSVTEREEKDKQEHTELAEKRRQLIKQIEDGQEVPDEE